MLESKSIRIDFEKVAHNNVKSVSKLNMKFPDLRDAYKDYENPVCNYL